MDAQQVAAAKHHLRQWARGTRSIARRRVGAAADEAVVAALLDSALLDEASVVAAYLAFGDEVDLAALSEHLVVHAHGKRLVLPRMVAGPQRRLTWHRATLEGLECLPSGLHQPASTAEQIELSEIDLFLVPGLAFDRGGGRLGYGAGYYDRLLASAPAAIPRVGVTFDSLVVDRVPVSHHDVAMTHLVTESGLRPTDHRLR